MNHEEEEFNVAIAISASLNEKSFKYKPSKPFKKSLNKEQNITLETEPNSYHTTTYKIYNNRIQTPPPPYVSCSPHPTTNSETKNLEFLRNLQKFENKKALMEMDANSTNNHVESIYPSLSATPSMVHQTHSPIHQISIHQTPLNMPQQQETVVTLRNQNIVKRRNPSIVFQFLVCGKDINAS